VPPPTARVVEPLDADTELPPDEADWDVPEVPTKVVAVVAEPAPKPVPEVSPVVRPTPLPEVKVEPTPAPDAETVPSLLPSPEVVPEKPSPPTLEPTSEVVEAPAAEASAHPTIARSEPGGRRPRPTPLIVVAVVLAGLGIALMVKALSPGAHQRTEPSQALRPAATLPPMAENLASAAIEPVAPVATSTDVASAADATPPSTIVASTTPIATPTPAAGPTATTSPRVRAPAPPRDPLCPNCATHPYQCGKFSLPQGRGDCYCGCSANSHCALQPGRSTGPCVPNGDGVSGVP
jgi:hypothetical protein